MAITFTKQKYCVLTLNNWMVVSIPISSDGFGVNDRKQVLRGFSTQTYASEIVEDSGSSGWVPRHRRRGKR